MMYTELEVQSLKQGLKESQERLNACMFHLVILVENVKQTLKDVAQTIESVRDRLGELEKGE